MTQDDDTDLLADAQARADAGTLVQDHATLRREHERLAAALADAHGELDRLIYAAGHDLRAPLRGIAHLSEWIEDDLEGEVSDETAAAIGGHLTLRRRRVQRLSLLVDGLLAYSRAGRGRFDAVPLSAEPSTLRALAEWLRTGGAAPLGGARLRLVLGDGADTRLVDAKALGAVLRHLVANAIRHTPGDGVVNVTLSCEDGAAAELVEVRIRDDGPGIDPRYHERVWELFQTLAPRDEVEGAGVGLSVVARVVRDHGGEVGLDSTPGEGATFRFGWPRA